MNIEIEKTFGTKINKNKKVHLTTESIGMNI